MTTAALVKLISALAPVMPSEAAVHHAGREWQCARAAWVEASAALANLDADDADARADYRAALADYLVSLGHAAAPVTAPPGALGDLCRALGVTA